jgi:prolyl 4-hydroxylase
VADRILANASQRAAALSASGAVRGGYELLEQAIASGDALAAATLAEWRMAGHFIRRDLAEARRLYGLSLQLGLAAAAERYVALLASGPGGSGRDWPAALAFLESRDAVDPAARAQLALLHAMDLTADGDPASAPTGTILCRQPEIAQLPEFLTSSECDYLRQLAAPTLQPAQIVDPHSGALRPDPVRRARSAAFPLVAENPVLHAINRRIAVATGTRWEQGEPLQVLAYRPGEEYRLHSDALPGGGNQRALTFLVAVNDDYEGGKTSFPALGIAWRGRKGDALAFRNIEADGEPASAARHAGNPVKRGEKFILSRWIRAAPLDLAGPPGRPF